jgi:hypothetical protein
MDFALDELKPPMMAAPEDGGLGVDAPADADIRGYLYMLGEPLVADSEEKSAITPVEFETGDDAVFLPAWHRRLQPRDR